MRAVELLRNVERKLLARKPLVEVGISKKNLLHNLHTYQKLYPGLKIAPVLKSNAYGHDLGLVGRLLDGEDIAFFMVDSLYEARRLRQVGIRSRIVVMGYARPQDMQKRPPVKTDFGITDLEQLRTAAKIVKKPLRIHIKLDTGMHRQGIQEKDLAEAVELIRSNKSLKLVGVASHFADADNAEEAFSRGQITNWNRMLKVLTSSFNSIEYRHIAATKGVRFGSDTDTNVARVGIGLYGFDTSPSGETHVAPVLELRSLIASVREISAGESVGYNATYTAKKDMRIATVPVGYFEGVDRRLSSNGCMLVHGIACPIVGRVSMNMSSIDITEVPSAKQGDVVTVISRDPSALNSVSNMTKAVSTPEYKETEYVTLVHIPQHLKRVVE